MVELDSKIWVEPLVTSYLATGEKIKVFFRIRVEVHYAKFFWSYSRSECFSKIGARWLRVGIVLAVGTNSSSLWTYVLV